MTTETITYYAKRALEYEKIYSKPERQDELGKLKVFLQDEFRGGAVYEAACGTGYWTQYIAKAAKSVHACDINEEVLTIAKAKQIENPNVVFHNEDILRKYNETRFDSLFGGFIWSHIPLENIHDFLDSVESRVRFGGKIILIDNSYVEGSSTPISAKDKQGNTYQRRKLDNGLEYQVIKNFPSEQFIKETITDHCIKFEYISWKYFWILKYYK
ncbi:MAG: class I SAM-dependent methyltransferase [Ignavibacteriaceae bacterium]